MRRMKRRRRLEREGNGGERERKRESKRERERENGPRAHTRLGRSCSADHYRGRERSTVGRAKRKKKRDGRGKRGGGERRLLNRVYSLCRAYGQQLFFYRSLTPRRSAAAENAFATSLRCDKITSSLARGGGRARATFSVTANHFHVIFIRIRLPWVLIPILLVHLGEVRRTFHRTSRISSCLSPRLRRYSIYEPVANR